MHGLIFKTSICYWQDQPGIYRSNKRVVWRKKPKSRLILHGWSTIALGPLSNPLSPLKNQRFDPSATLSPGTHLNHLPPFSPPSKQYTAPRTLPSCFKRKRIKQQAPRHAQATQWPRAGTFQIHWLMGKLFKELDTIIPIMSNQTGSAWAHPTFERTTKTCAEAQDPARHIKAFTSQRLMRAFSKRTDADRLWNETATAPALSLWHPLRPFPQQP